MKYSFTAEHGIGKDLEDALSRLQSEIILTVLVTNNVLAVVWNTFSFYVELLLYSKFLNNGLTLEGLG